jgi:hypothetical protein
MVTQMLTGLGTGQGKWGASNLQLTKLTTVQSPATVLNLTLTMPSWRVRLLQMAKGNRPAVRSAEICASTLGLLGAESSFRTSHFGGPLRCVIAIVQPGGASATVDLSNEIVSAFMVKNAKRRKIRLLSFTITLYWCFGAISSNSCITCCRMSSRAAFRSELTGEISFQL